MAKQTPTLAMHEHSYLGKDRALKSRDPNKHDIRHSHEGGNGGHKHPDCGPACFPGGMARAKKTVKPNGTQLPIVPMTTEERTFTVVWVDEYTSAHASAGITPERYARERDAFISLMEGRDEYTFVSADERLVNEFDMLPIYEMRVPTD